MTPVRCACCTVRPSRWAAPDVDLEPSITAQEDAGIRIRQRHSHLLAMNVACVGAIRQDVGYILVEEGRLFEPPIHMQDEIAILALAPERLVTPSFALGIVVDDAIDDLPV